MHHLIKSAFPKIVRLFLSESAYQLLHKAGEI